MTLCSEIHHKIGIILAQYPVNDLFVADVAFYESHVIALDISRYRRQMTGICERVEHGDIHVATITGKQIFHEIRAYESGASGNKIFFDRCHFLIFISQSGIAGGGNRRRQNHSNFKVKHFSQITAMILAYFSYL